MLTNERAEILAKYLTNDRERAQALIVLEPQEAVAKINADGYDFSATEIAEFGEQMKAAVTAQGDELSEDELSGVAGGEVFVTGAVAVAVAVGYTVAYARTHRIW